MKIKSKHNNDSKGQQVKSKSMQSTLNHMGQFKITQSPKKLKLNREEKSEIVKRSVSPKKAHATTMGIGKSPDKHPVVDGNLIDSLKHQLKHKKLEVEARKQIPASTDDSKYESFGLNNLFFPSSIDSSLTEPSDSEDNDDDDDDDGETPVNVPGNYITLNKVALKKTLKLLSSQPTKKPDKAAKQKAKFHRTCYEVNSHTYDVIHWQSYTYVVRAIRNSILERDWQHLKELLRLMLKQPKIFKNYIKEITYLYFLINADSIDPRAVEDYFLLCFSSYDKSKKPMREFDICFKNHEF